MTPGRAIAFVVAFAVAAGFGFTSEAQLRAQRDAIRISAPPRERAVAESIVRTNALRMATVASFVGYDGGGGPIDVVIAEESSPQLRGIPTWVAGWAQPETGLVVLIPSRSVSYPDDSLEETYLHELAHVFSARAAGAGDVPRWFDEGVAVVAGRAWTLEDRSRMAWAAIASRNATPDRVDRMFLSTESDVRSAYAISEAFVRFAMDRYGSRSIANVFRAMNDGYSFDDAFARVTGRPVGRAWIEFWKTQALSRVSLPILASSTALWFLILVVATIALIRRRRRNRLRLQLWELEEQRADLRRETTDDSETVN